jgi:hypothetical protein
VPRPERRPRLDVDGGSREGVLHSQELVGRRPTGVTKHAARALAEAIEGGAMAGGRRRQRAPLASAELGGLHALGRHDEGLDIVGVFQGQTVHDPHRQRRHASSLHQPRGRGVASLTEPDGEGVPLPGECLRRYGGEGS